MREFLVTVSLLISFASIGQNKLGAEIKVDEGVVLHDKGAYAEALVKYNEALDLDKNNLMALAEKAFTLISLNKYDECILCCKKAIETHPGENDLKNVYVTYGNASDALKRPQESLRIYDEGLSVFPDYYQLHYNKGITLAHEKQNESAILCFQQAVKVNPSHGSSHNAIARISFSEDKNIPSLLAYCRFLAIEQKSERAIVNLASLQQIMAGNVERTGKNSVTVRVSPEMVEKDGAPKQENNFATVDLMLSMTSALDYDKKYKRLSEVENFIRKFDMVCSILEENKTGNSGFFWEYYAPYFTEMKNKNLVEPFAYIVFISKAEKKNSKWIHAHRTEIDNFFAWSEAYQWVVK